jgi:hypothetical protein
VAEKLVPHRLPFSRQSFLYFLHPLPIWLGKTVDQAIGANIKRMTDTNEIRHGKRIPAFFEITDGLPVNAHHLGEAFLCEIGGKPCLLNILSDNP